MIRSILVPAAIFSVALGICTAPMWLVPSAPRAESTAQCSTDAECAALPECLADPTCDGGPVPVEPTRVLIGYECDGTQNGEVVVAREEDEFLDGKGGWMRDLDGDGRICKRIEAQRLWRMDSDGSIY
jgi:hypothetical protein